MRRSSCDRRLYDCGRIFIREYAPTEEENVTESGNGYEKQRLNFGL